MPIIWKRPDGGIAITYHTHPNAQEWADMMIANGDAPGVLVDLNGSAPDDRTFRNAWTHGAGVVSVRMPEARNIWRDKMREARAPKLLALDADYMKADEAGNQAQKVSIAAQKQALRDVTALPEIEAAATPEALKAIWPAILA